jgi:hypothetical protein
MNDNNIIMKTHFVVLMALLFISFSNWADAQGNFVFNGGFDTDASGWTINNGLSFYNAKNGNPPGDFVLDDISPSSTDPTVSQIINGLTPGTSYIVSGDYLLSIDRGGGSPTEPSFGVSIENTLLFGTIAPTDFNWHSFNFLYSATSTSAVLSLSSQMNGTGFSYSVDNISMQAVPEPSAYALLGLGLLALARRRFYQRHSGVQSKALRFTSDQPTAFRQ